MKIETQTDPDLQKIGDLIQEIPIAMLTSIDADDRLVSRPMSVLKMDRNGVFWLFADTNSTTVDQLDRVNLSFSNSKGSTYVSIAGHGEVSHERALVHELWTPLMRPWFSDGEKSPNLALLKISAQTAEYWDAGHGKMVQLFALAASVIGGKPVGMGDHGTIDLLESP